jgi:hypothetical protein
MNTQQIQNRNMYDTNTMNQVYNYEMNNMSKNYELAKQGPQNCIIPNKGYNQKILNKNNTTKPYNNTTVNQLNISANRPNFYISPLSGETIPVENFQHNNMVPFFKGNATQSINTDVNKHLLEKHTGSSDNYRRKGEVKSFFDVTSNNSYVNGNPSFTTQKDITQRYIPSQKRQNELPIQKIRVGPGLASGYVAEPSGGLNQSNVRDFVMPKNVDQLRAASKPKSTGLEGRLNPGNLKSGTRGKVGRVVKNKVNTFYKNTPDMYLKTGGAVKGAMIRNKFFAKPNNRLQSRTYYGGLGPTDHTKGYKVGGYRKTRRNNYMNPSPRNATAKDNWMLNKNLEEQGLGDYNKSSIENKPNERDITQKRQVISNLTSEVKKIMIPLQDFIRKTRKENFVGNIRPDGNMKANMPSKMTVYDPDDIARTTIKETNIHNEHEGFIKGNNKQTIQDPSDVAKTTIKETNIHNNTPYINMSPQQPKCLRVYDPDDVPNTTIKETNIHNEHYGFVENSMNLNPGAYTTNNVEMKNTNKQFISDYEYTGIANADTETGGGRGYLASNYNAKNTHKQFLSNYEYSGNAAYHTERPMSYADKYNARLNPNKEELAVGRSPTKQGTKVTVGEDLVNIQHKKIETDRINIREPAETAVYQAPPQQNRCGITSMKDKLPENVQRMRISNDLLTPFNENPYTQSLNSAV